jgi:hypothetical protein
MKMFRVGPLKFRYSLQLCALALSLFLAVISQEADARKKLFPSKSASTASHKIKTQDPNALADAIVQVFESDGYYLKHESESRLLFVRTASRSQELSYGSPLSPGSTESVAVTFYPVDSNKFQVDCNVRIMSGETVSLADAEILPLFGRQYKRMLRQVSRTLK